MSRKLIIDGTAVYEIDEDLQLQRRLKEEEKRIAKLKEKEKKDEKGTGDF